MPIRSSFEILANFFGFYRTKSRDSRGSMSSRWSRSSRGSIDSVHPDSDEEEENQEPEETEEQLKARLRKEANLRQYSRSAEERERAAQGAISDMFELAEEDEKTRKKRRYREARIAAGKTRTSRTPTICRRRFKSGRRRGEGPVRGQGVPEGGAGHGRRARGLAT